MKHRLARTASLLVVAVAAAACATTENGDGASQTAQVYVQVQNDARADLQVSLVTDGQELRIGRVQLGDRRRFRVPAPVLREPPYAFAVRVVARDGSGSYTTPRLNVPQGQNVYIEASATLQSSRFSVR